MGNSTSPKRSRDKPWNFRKKNVCVPWRRHLLLIFLRHVLIQRQSGDQVFIKKISRAPQGSETKCSLSKCGPTTVTALSKIYNFRGNNIFADTEEIGYFAQNNCKQLYISSLYTLEPVCTERAFLYIDQIFCKHSGTSNIPNSDIFSSVSCRCRNCHSSWTLAKIDRNLSTIRLYRAFRSYSLRLRE